MTYQFTVSPDFTPDHLSGWYIFNTWLQRKTGESIHLEMYNDFQSQRKAIENDDVDLIYANPYDAAMLVREKGFLPVARPDGHSDEAIIAVNTENKIMDVADLQPGCKISGTDDPDVLMMGMIMLEPADLTKDNSTFIEADSYVLVAKQLLTGNADVGIFLANAYDDMSSMIQQQLRILVRSQIDVIHHALLVGPKLQNQRQQLLDELLALENSDKGKKILESLGFSHWQTVEDEETEFMIDLMDTLAV